MTEIETIAKSLSEAQREWLLSMEPHLNEQERDYDKVFDADCFVDFKPAEYCEETGALLCPPDRIWLGGQTCFVGSHATAHLSALGQAVRDYLKGEK